MLHYKIKTGRKPSNCLQLVLIQPFQEQYFTDCCVEWKTIGHQSYANQEKMTSWKVYYVTGCPCSLKPAFKMLYNYKKKSGDFRVEKYGRYWNGTNLNFNHVPPGRTHMHSRIFPLMIYKLNKNMKKHQANKTSCRMNSVPSKFPSQKLMTGQGAVVS